MNKRILRLACIVLTLVLVMSTVSFAAEESVGSKVKRFWRKLFSYPANVTNESANVVAETGKRTTNVVTKEVKTVGEVTSGDIDKTKNLVTEPITGSAETAVKAVEETAKIPVEAAKEETEKVQSPTAPESK